MTRILEYLIELLNWFKIALSPTLIGVAIGLVVYLNKPDDAGRLIAIGIAVLGLIIGIVIATIVARRTGTNNFMSRLHGHPQPGKKGPNSSDK